MVNKRLQVWLPLLFSLVMILGMVVGYKIRQDSSMPGFFKTSNKSVFQEVLDLVDLKYVDKVETDTLGNKAISGILHKLDPHSVFIPSSELMQVNDDLRGNFTGIGVEFQVFYDTVNILNVLPGGPSEKAGMLVGDKVITINDTIKLAGQKINPENIRKYLRGKKGTPVKVTVFRNGKMVPLIIERGTIPVPSVDASYMIDGQTGFIHLNRFSENTYREFMQAMEKLQAQKMQHLILDLRGNGGGLLNQAVNIADEFLDEDKLIVYTQGSHVPKYEYKSSKEGLFEKGDMAVLVDESSASASEVLSGALQDWDRATIIGRRSFGKGLVQEQFGLSDGSALRLTVARYYTPLGRNIQKSYNNGYAEYEEEVMVRFHNGEVMKPDTTKNKGAAFKTKKGKIVYGGGGITPDVFVPFDTTSMGKALLSLYAKGTLNNFIYTYYIQHKAELAAYKKPSDFSNGFQSGDREWEELKRFASKDSINLDKFSIHDKEYLQKRIPSMLARQIWRYDGYYQVMNKTDDFIQKALQVLNVRTTVNR